MNKLFRIVLLLLIFQFELYGQNTWIAKKVETPDGLKWGFFNSKGKTQLEPIYDTVFFKFTNGLAGVGQLLNDSLKAGVIDKKGKFVLEYKYSDVHLLGQYLAVENLSHFWGLMNVNLDLVVPFQYKKLIDQDSVLACQVFAEYDIYDLQNGSTRTVFADSLILRDKHLSICRNGKISPLSQVNSFIEEKAVAEFNNTEHPDSEAESLFQLVKEEAYYGFKDTSGNIVVSIQYEDAKSFSEGLAPVKIMGKWAYINSQEEFIIQPRFEEAWPFYKSSALVKIDGYYNFIAPNGTLRNKKGFTKVERLPTGNWQIWSGNDIGLADSLGNEQIIPKYTLLHDWGNGYVCFLKHGLYGVLDYKQNIIMSGKYTHVFRQNQFIIGQLSSSKYILKSIAKK
jgi:hypothetical protein